MEIIFRAWHKKQRRFYHFDIDTVTRGQRGFYLPIGGISGAMNCELDDTSLYAEKELRTDLQDKNGRPIFQGDKLWDEVEDMVAIVTSEEGCWVGEYESGDTVYLCHMAPDSQVIGHIHEEGA